MDYPLENFENLKYFKIEQEQITWNDPFIPSQESTCDLDQIAKKYNCDKGNIQFVSPAWRNIQKNIELTICGHNYVQIYDDLFKNKRYQKLNILEIGMGNAPTNGYSLQMWLEYFPNANVHIIDKYESNFICNFAYDKSRSFFYQVDQSCEQELVAFSKKFPNNFFDIIIDDGSHQGLHQLLGLKILYQNLKFDGFYCIEDVIEFEYFYKLIDEINKITILNKNATSNTLNNLGSIFLYPSLCVLHKKLLAITR